MSDNQQQDIHFLDYWRVISSRKEIVIAVTLLVLVTGIIVTLSLPKEYMASHVIQVKEDQPDLSVFAPEMVRIDPIRFLQTQFEILKSRRVLDEVVAKCSLDTKLASARGMEDMEPARLRELALKELENDLRVQQYRDTNLIEVKVYLSSLKDRSRQEAKLLADTVVEVFRDQTLDRSRKATDAALRALYASLQDQQEEVDKATAAVNAIREKYGIQMIGENSRGSSSLEQMTLMHLEEMRIRTNLEVADKQSRNDYIASLSSEDLLAAAPYLVQDTVTAELSSSRREAQVELGQLRENFGEKHPDVLRVKRVISELDAKIADALDGLRTGVRADYEAAQAKLKIIVAELDRRKAREIVAEGDAYQQYTIAKDKLERARRLRDALEMRYLQEQIKKRIPKSAVETISEAKVPDKDENVSPNLPLNAVLSLLLGLSAGIGLAYFIEYLDTSVKTIEDIEATLGLQVLGVIPQKVRPLSEANANVAHAEFYRVLRTNTMFSERFKEGKTLCFTSGSMGEGKSLTLYNLAYVCSQLGEKTILIDSDLHRPRQHKMFGVSNKLGLANVLIGECTLDEVVHSEVHPNLDFLPSGKLDSGVHGLLDTQRMRALVATLKERYDRVYFDAPPIIGVSDAAVICREVDGVMLLIQHRKYPKALSIRAKGMLENMGTNILGVVLNNINISKDQSYYYYHHYYYQSEYTKGSQRPSVARGQRKA